MFGTLSNEYSYVVIDYKYIFTHYNKACSIIYRNGACNKFKKKSTYLTVRKFGVLYS